MAVTYGLSPFEVLEIIYGGKTDGIEPEEFERNKTERGVEVPKLMREFLEKYAYMSVNRQSDGVRLHHPNIMTSRLFEMENNTLLELLTTGRAGNFQIAVEDKPAENPAVYLLKVGEGPAQITPSNDRIDGIIKSMVYRVLLKFKGAVVSEDAAQAVALLRENGADLEQISGNAELPRDFSFNFSEEMRTFIVAELERGELASLAFIRDESFLKV